MAGNSIFHVIERLPDGTISHIFVASEKNAQLTFSQMYSKIRCNFI